jgi:hypothetical protein
MSRPRRGASTPDGWEFSDFMSLSIDRVETKNEDEKLGSQRCAAPEFGCLKGTSESGSRISDREHRATRESDRRLLASGFALLQGFRPPCCSSLLEHYLGDPELRSGRHHLMAHQIAHQIAHGVQPWVNHPQNLPSPGRATQRNPRPASPKRYPVRRFNPFVENKGDHWVRLAHFAKLSAIEFPFGAVWARFRLSGDLGAFEGTRRAETARKADRSARLDAPISFLQRVPGALISPATLKTNGEIGFVCAVLFRPPTPTHAAWVASVQGSRRLKASRLRTSPSGWVRWLSPICPFGGCHRSVVTDLSPVGSVGSVRWLSPIYHRSVRHRSVPICLGVIRVTISQICRAGRDFSVPTFSSQHLARR